MEGEPLVINEGMTKSAVHIDEAVEYGFGLLRGITKYIAFIFLWSVTGTILIAMGWGIEGSSGSVLMLTGLLCLVGGGILGLALSIGVMYKLWVDILARSRQQKTTLRPLVVNDPP